MWSFVTSLVYQVGYEVSLRKAITERGQSHVLTH